MSFTLLTLPQVSLRAGTSSHDSPLTLEYVPGGDDVSDSKSTYAPGTLLFHVGPHSYGLVPGSSVELVIAHNGQRSYSFDATNSEKRNSEVHIVIPAPIQDDPPHIAQDIETFDHVLTQSTTLSWRYESPNNTPPPLPARSPRPSTPQPVHHEQANIKVNVEEAKPVGDPNLRGRLVFMDASNGDIVGELPKTMDIHEDPAFTGGANASDAVVLEMQPELYDAYTGAKDLSAVGDELHEAREIIVRAVPPEERDWVLKSATLVSHAISGSTSLLLAGITSASNYYIAHSAQGPQKSPSNSASSPSSLPSGSSSSALATAHSVSGKARAVSSKTSDMVGNLISRAMGGKASSGSGASTTGSQPYMASLQGPPPTYAVYTPKHGSKLPPRMQSGGDDMSGNGPQVDVPGGSPRMRDKLLMSANLLITTIDDSARRVFEVGTDRLGAVVGHKYGPEAQRSTHLASHTARNVVLVYVDMRGFARRALLKKAGKEFVKARVKGNKH